MRPIRVVIGSATSSAVIPLDQYISPFNVGLAAVLSAGASLTYTVEHTLDDVFAPTFNAATATWFPHATLAAKTASSDGNYAYPVSAIRIRVSIFASGTVTLNVMQAGITT